MNRLLHSRGARLILITLCISGGVSPVFATTTDEIIDEPIAASCGEIIIPENFKYEEQEEERTAIENCDNPFNADDTVSYELVATLNTQPLTEGETVVMPAGTSEWQLSYLITYAEQALNSETIDLYRRIGNDYYASAEGFNKQGSVVVTTPGDYVLVVSAVELLFNQRNERLFDRWFSYLIPTAQAYYEDYAEVYTLSFTVAIVPPSPPSGASSVLFLPGIQASRLYAGTAISNPGWDNDIEKDELLWEPGNNDDVRALAMSETGVSIHEVYTKDVLDEIYGVSNIYRGFLNFLERLKRTETMPIREYEAFAYDWRYSVQDIVVSGTRHRQEIKSLVSSVENLAANSYTGRVTIVAHSNGGLLAKALMIELDRIDQAELVDTIIFIGTPHLGTPKALGTALHGYDQQQVGGLVIDDEVAREIINNLPGAYALLPSKVYLTQSKLPIISFREGVMTEVLREQFGETIDSAEEYVDFLNGIEGRNPVQNDISSPYTTNPLLLTQALESHQSYLDAWQPPEHLQVHNIVGVGLPTMKGLEYRNITESSCIPVANTSICSSRNFLRPFAQFTQYGDETVTSLSAEEIVGEQYYFNFELFRDSTIFNNRDDHATFTEINDVQKFIENVLINTTTNIPYLSQTKPFLSKTYDIIAIDSPVSIKVINSEGKQSGIIRRKGEDVVLKEISGSDYFEFAETKYLIIPNDEDIKIQLSGYESGRYTLTIAALANDSQVIRTQLRDATTTPKMIATFTLENGEYSTIVTDLNGDGLPESETTLNGKAVDVSEVNFQDLRIMIKALELKRTNKKLLLTHVTLVEKLSAQSIKNKIFRRASKRAFDRLEKQLKLYTKRNLVSEGNLSKLLALIHVLENKKIISYD